MAKKTPGVIRTTITIPNDLKRQMEKVKEDVNWSALACQAFEAKLAEISAKKVKKDMNDVIQRLKQSKRQNDNAETTAGREAGEEWAKDTAEAIDLERLDAIVQGYENDASLDWREFLQGDGPLAYSAAERLFFAINRESEFDRRAAESFWENVVDDPSQISPSFLGGFVDGALEIWEQVKAEL